MSAVRWLHVSDLHLNSEGTETQRLREMLPKYFAVNVQYCDYVFCTGDIRQAPNGFAADSAEYIKKLCAAVQVPVERFFLVAGNHDVNRSHPERISAIKKLRKTYYSKTGLIDETILAGIHKGQEDFRKVLADLYAGVPGRLAYYENPQAPHFVIQTEHFNILHVDSTVSYAQGSESNLILGTGPLIKAVKMIDQAKPTILLTHYAISFLSQDERAEVSNLLRDNNIKLWLAGHEHDHNLMPYGYLYSVQAGELQFEERAHATVLVGEYDTDTGRGEIEAHTWFPEGWAKYPLLWRGYSDEYAKMDKFPFALGLPGIGTLRSREAQKCFQSNQIHHRLKNKVIPELLPDLNSKAKTYTGQSALSQVMDALWNMADPHLILTGDGGTGKTTILLNAAMQRSNQAILYLSMEQLQAHGISIEQQVCRILFGSGDARNDLFQMVNVKRAKPALILLLDGFNELTQAEAQYVKELRGLSAYPGIQIVVTSREDFKQRYPIAFHSAALAELSEAQVRGILTEKEWGHIKDKFTLKKLLKNPMLLLMYKQICPVIETHRNPFLTWADPIVNVTQLIHNYFTAQIAILLDHEELTGKKVLQAYQCLGYALPYIGFHMELEGQLSISSETFEGLMEEAAQQAEQCSFLDQVLRRVQREYRERVIPDISAFEIEDYLVKESHLLHEEDGRFSFSHQIYRDYMSAAWIVHTSVAGDAIETLWNQRELPYYITEHIRNMSGRYWDGLAKQIADASRRREGVSKQIRNLIHTFPYTQESGVPDFSGLDLRDVRLPDYSGVSARIPMRCAKISKVSLALLDMNPVTYRSLTFSANHEWLAGLSKDTLHVWSMRTGAHELISCTGQRLISVYFTQDGRYLLVRLSNDVKTAMEVYIHDEGWMYQCMIMDDHYKEPVRMSIMEDTLYIYYDNRERRYSLLDGNLLYNKKKPKTWTIPQTGEALPRYFMARRAAKQKKGLPERAACQVESADGEFRACSYVNGALTVFHGGERYLSLQQGIEILRAAAISGDGKRAVTLSQKRFGDFRKVQMWDLEHKRRCGEILCGGSIQNIHLSRSGEWIIGEMGDQYWVRSWSDKAEQYTISGKFLSNQNRKLTFYENRIIYRSGNGPLKLYNLDTKRTEELKSDRKNGEIAAIMPNGELVVIGDDASKVIFRSIRGNWTLDVNREDAAVTGLIFMKNQPFVAVATQNGRLCIYHTGTGQRLRILRPNSGNSLLVAHPNKDAIACSGGGNRFEIFNLYTKKVGGENHSWWYQNPTDSKLTGKVLDMAFNEANQELVTIMSDGTIAYSHELYCRYHGSIRIITNFNVDAFDFTDVICGEDAGIVLRNNGAMI